MSVSPVSQQEFQEKVLNHNGLLILDFWASWCGPCKALAPVLEALSEEYGDVEIVKTSIEEHPDLAIEHMVMSVPTLIFFKDGEKQKTLTGGKTREELVAVIEEMK